MLETLQDTWCNQDNCPFYEKMPLEEFIEHARLSGISNGEDVEELKGFLIQSESILEVGCGYGRVLKKIFDLGYVKNLESIEVNKRNYQFCQEHVGDSVNIYNGNILTYPFQNKYDLILFMWSGISEFSPGEQLKLFFIFSNLLTQRGYLAVDKINCDLPKNNVEVNDKVWNVEGESASENLYMPTEEELLVYAKASGMSCKKKIVYMASNDVPRVIYIFSLF